MTKVKNTAIGVVSLATLLGTANAQSRRPRPVEESNSHKTKVVTTDSGNNLPSDSVIYDPYSHTSGGGNGQLFSDPSQGMYPDPYMAKDEQWGDEALKWIYRGGREANSIPDIIKMNDESLGLKEASGRYRGWVPGEGSFIQDKGTGKTYTWDGTGLKLTENPPKERYNDGYGYGAFGSNKTQKPASAPPGYATPKEVPAANNPDNDNSRVPAANPTEPEPYPCTLYSVPGSKTLTLRVKGLNHAVIRMLPKNATPDQVRVFDKQLLKTYIETPPDTKGEVALWAVYGEKARMQGHIDPKKLGDLNPLSH